MKKAIKAILLGATIFALTACDNGGSKFEGKWSCDSGLGKLTMSIRNNGGNDYIIDDYPVIGKVSMTYKDGNLVGPQGMRFSIDKQSDKLIGMNVCEMSRIK